MKTVISASRRTDLPRWFLDDVIKWFEAGSVTVKNPFNQKPYTISLKREDVHSIVWWSKDFSRFIAKQDFFSGYNQTFQFTINGYTNNKLRFLEPGMTASLQERLDQARILADRYRPEAINWRFDPIVFWEEKGDLVNNLEDYAAIASAIANIGIKRNTISFTQWYGKCTRRANKRKFPFINPSPELRRSTARMIAGIAKPLGIKVFACCNADIVMQGLIEPSACIDGTRLARLFGEEAFVQKDTGQREACGCTKSKDIGSYDMICKHGCIYCYANPQL
ncbi:MAG: DUF1848 domain-containing protein [Candidatus Lokiarchaeota archaeon]|nr:DUF1848 domain-containing protein [Candidatus Lokiarchaeota archaeon]